MAANMPRRVKWRKCQKGRIRGNASRGNTVASGVYLYKIEAGGESKTLRLTHLK